MTARTSRTISVLEGDWERWKEAAWQRRIPSVSEFIRKAVEAYEHGSQAPNVAGVAGEGRRSVRRSGGGIRSGGRPAADEYDGQGDDYREERPAGERPFGPSLDTTPAGWEDGPIISAEEAKERVEAIARDTAEPGWYCPYNEDHVCRRADCTAAACLAVEEDYAAATTSIEDGGAMLPRLRSTRQPYTKASQTKRRGKG